MSLTGLTRIDRQHFDIKPGEVLCIACVRNEALRIPYFLEYHRALGVDRFLIVDNASEDGSTDVLLSNSDVHVFLTGERYSDSQYGMTWINSLLESHAVDHWTLTVDADELFVYPSSEVVGLRRLGAALDRLGADALLTFMLDMYSDKAVRETHYTRGTPFLETCPYFDADSYVWGKADQPYASVPSRGGPRGRLFDGQRWFPHALSRNRVIDWLMALRVPGAVGASPFLPKVPFVRWRRGQRYTVSTHYLPDVCLAETTGALLHFKFFSDFTQRVKEEAARREHWRGASEYAVYSAALRKNPDLDLLYEGSVRYRNSQQLVQLGLARISDDFKSCLTP